MNNGHYYTNQRNNYFFGKLMTAKDFINEQKYFNSKRYLCSRMLGGVGIVSGLDVILMDNHTFSLETGMAIDHLGREIIVSEPCVRKLNVIKGFEENKNNHTVYLCIRYKENLNESTFSLASAGKQMGENKQFNRISEDYELYLTSDISEESELTLDFLVKKRTEIYNKNNVKITMETEKYINSNKITQIRLFFEKEKIEEAINYNFELYGNLFKVNETSSNRNLIIKYDESEITSYKSIQKDYFLYCDAQESVLTEMIIPKDTFVLNIGKEKYNIEKNISIPIQVVTEDIRNLIVRDYYSRHFDEILELAANKNIYLAKFNIINNKTSYFIEEFKKHPFEQFLYSNELLKLLQDFQGTNVKKIRAEKKIDSKAISIEGKDSNEKNNTYADADNNNDKKNNINNNEKNNILSGIERINLGFNAKPGKIYYSYEFVHGLGLGEIGVLACAVNRANIQEYEKELLIFGDKSIFSEEELKSSVPSIQIAAAVDVSKGTIKLGVRLLEKTIDTHIDIRWWAFKPVKEQDPYKDLILEKNATVTIKPNTVGLKPFEQIRFEASIDGINDKRIRWELGLKNTGNIDNNGLYTAPATEGVYEIKAYSVRLPDIYSSAYVIVSNESGVGEKPSLPEPKLDEDKNLDKNSKNNEKKDNKNKEKNNDKDKIPE
ncbi:MAG: hypothetical protein CfP315_0076 [Candidatus Improbicoccus pseudotrichonymphae]|uniref:Uncharacterized protein n=1 Tax=Candidatus Improbicoccus pseudotrichonymphae TaxID=3033792 RepID=A0AA48I0M6_9FIRM|nr:MAG: hypothetical protein CfP315_0076 [Candidatus Improbicoccus pseudotrichonymphae]